MARCLSRRGATKVEYALVILLVGVSCILVVGALGEGVGGLFDGARTTFSGANADDPTAATAEPEDDTGKGKDKGKAKSARPNGNPGQGNAGNDKTVGNAGAAGG